MQIKKVNFPEKHFTKLQRNFKLIVCKKTNQMIQAHLLSVNTLKPKKSTNNAQNLV